MRAPTLTLVALAGFGLFARAAHAQLGVLGPATTLGRGRVGAAAAGLLFAGRPRVNGAPRTVEGIDDGAALLLRGAYGAAGRVDLQARAVVAEDIYEGGVGVKVRLLDAGPLALAASAGAHVELFRTDFSADRFHFPGVDATLTASARLRPPLSVYGALDLAFESADVDLRRDGAAVHLGGFTRAAIVPGLEYVLRANFRAVAEAGVALNDRSFGYVAGGLAYSWR